MSEVLRVEKAEGIATLTLSRPEARNALNRALRDAIRAAFAALERDDAVGAVILTGAGAAFCAGLDLKELVAARRRPRRRPPRESAHDIVQAIEALRAPVIGAINGVAVTGGFELALACDVLVGSTAARFADTHARVGILPGWGLSVKLPRLVGIGRAKAHLAHRQLRRRRGGGAHRTARARGAAGRAAADVPSHRARHALVRAAHAARLQAR